MPVFYLHQRSGDREVHDLEGAHFANLEAAVDEAIDSARALMADRVRRGIEPDGWRFEIRDRRGVLLAVVPFQETLSPNGDLDPVREAKWFRVDSI